MLSQIKFINTLIVAIPLAFVFSPLFLELIFIIISFLFGYQIYKSREFYFFNNFFFKLFFLFSLYLFLTMLFFQRFEDGIQYSLFYFRYIFYILSLYYFFRKINNSKNLFLISFLLINLILIFDGLFQFFNGFNLIGHPLVNATRVSSFFGEEKILGGFLARISPLCLCLYFINKNEGNYKILRSLIIFILISNVFLILLSGERSAFFLYIFYILLIFTFLKFKIFKKLIILFSIFSVFFTVLFFSENTKERIVNQTIFEISKFSESQNDMTKKYYKKNEIFELKELPFYIFSPTHTNYIFTAINIFKDNKTFGAGPKAFKRNCVTKQYSINKWSCSTHPHNYYIQILSEAGLIGFTFILIGYLTIVFRFIKISFLKNIDKNKANYLIILYGGLLMNFFPFIPTGNFFNNWLTIILLLPISLILTKDDLRK